jgi:hypothetical protein
MSRNENENIQDLNLPEKDEVNVEFIEKTGKSGEEHNAVAKIATIVNKEEQKKTINYYVKIGRGMIFDPFGMDSNKINAYNFQFKKADEKVFSYYLQYLKTRRSMFLTYAQREFQNKGY